MNQSPSQAGRQTPLKRLAKSVLRVSVTALIVYLVLMGCAMPFESSFIYFPSKYPQGDWGLVEDNAGRQLMSIEDVGLTCADGVKLHGWYCRPAHPHDERRPLLVWFHGNAGNITHRYYTLLEMAQMDLDVFILDYRGYGKSEGSPSEKGLYLDADAVWKHLTETRGVPRQRIVLFGRSLGGAVAVDLTHRLGSSGPAGLIVESCFTSAPDMAWRVFPLFPRFLVRTKLDSINKVGALTCPKLFVHSVDDEIVPFELGRKLFEAAAPPKQFYEIQGAGHNETDMVGGEPYFRNLRRFIEGCVESES